jgi:hypothetical protein
LYRDRALTQKTLCPDGKNHAIASLHRDSFLAKENRDLLGAFVG